MTPILLIPPPPPPPPILAAAARSFIISRFNIERHNLVVVAPLMRTYTNQGLVAASSPPLSPSAWRMAIRHTPLFLCTAGATLRSFYNIEGHRKNKIKYIFFEIFKKSLYTRDSLQREARASECSLQRAREGTPPYPTCCYARHMMRAVSDVM